MLSSLVFVVLLSLHAVYGEDDQTFALKFLNQYQYISQSRSGNQDVTSAIKNFQTYFGLPVSGQLDEATMALMHKPRCGMPDVDASGLRMRRYYARGKWDKKSLTYYIKYGQDLGSEQQDEIFRLAFKFWADKSALTFRQVKSREDADIKISFGTGYHYGTKGEGQCPYPFDGPGGVLAHAYYPKDGRAHFDEHEMFTHNTASGINLLWVAAHEFGHSLGLDHSNVRGALMYPYYSGYTPDMQLHSDDIRGIQSLYGVNTGGGGGVVTDAPVTAAPTNDPVCYDRDHNCEPYRVQGLCNKYPDHMKHWCYKSCGYC